MTPDEYVPADDVAMTMWTISRAPRGYVLHVNSALKNGHTRTELPGWAAVSADDLRDMLPPGLRNIGRNRSDDPAILEIWV